MEGIVTRARTRREQNRRTTRGMEEERAGADKRNTRRLTHQSPEVRTNGWKALQPHPPLGPPALSSPLLEPVWTQHSGGGRASIGAIGLTDVKSKPGQALAQPVGGSKSDKTQPVMGTEAAARSIANSG